MQQQEGNGNRKKPFVIEEIDGKPRIRSLNLDGTPRKVRVGKGRHFNPNPDPEKSARRREANNALNAKLKMIKDLSGGAINPYRKGVFDGHTKATAAPIWKKASEEAKVIVKYLKDNDMVDTPKDDKYAQYADEALEAAVTVVRTPANEQTRIAAARLILDFTRSKPVAKSEVNVKTAEDWLQNVMEDIKKD
jgi:hypothetical protein